MDTDVLGIQEKEQKKEVLVDEEKEIAVRGETKSLMVSGAYLRFAHGITAFPRMQRCDTNVTSTYLCINAYGTVTAFRTDSPFIVLNRCLHVAFLLHFPSTHHM